MGVPPAVRDVSEDCLLVFDVLPLDTLDSKHSIANVLMYSK